MIRKLEQRAAFGPMQRHYVHTSFSTKGKSLR